MRSADSPGARVVSRTLVTMFLAAGLAACAATTATDLAQSPAPGSDHVAAGPQADYPILVGEPYEIGGTVYTPADVLNYDEVGYLALETGTTGYTGAHHTLPVPSYAEVTSLETGRTVLVRLERRGPMNSNHLVALSPAAMAQLGGNIETPVRVRRVNPPEEQRAMLRQGNAAPLRMDTPMSLVDVLRRRLPESGSASLAASSAIAPSTLETVELDASTASATESAEPFVEPAQVAQAETEQIIESSAGEARDETITPTVSGPQTSGAPATASQPLEGGFVVQAAAFSSADNARRAADALGGAVSRSGAYYLLRTGPFATRGEAEASLANVRRAGYSDARILTSG